MSENNYGQEPGKNSEYVPGQYSNNGSTSAQDGSWSQQGQTPQHQPAGYQQPGNGTGNYYPQYGQTVQKPAGHGLGIAALVLGIVSLITCWFGLGALVGLVGLILGIVAILKLKKTPGSKKGMAITGLVLSILGLIAGVIVAIFMFFILNVASGGMEACADELESGDDAAYEQCIKDWAESEYGTGGSQDS